MSKMSEARALWDLVAELVIKQAGAGPFIAGVGLVIAAPVHLLRTGRSRTAMRVP
jgi:hypothetical protein